MYKLDENDRKNILAESVHYFVFRDSEAVWLCNKTDGCKIACVGDFYGNATDAFVDPEERFCISVGCGLIKYDIHEPFENYQYNRTDSQWIECGREGDIIWCDHIERVDDATITVVLDGGNRECFSVKTLKRNMFEDIREFPFGCRYTDEKYALFSDEELSKISVLNEDEAIRIWDFFCDNEVLEMSSFVKKLVSKELEVLIADCGWGEGGEEKTRDILAEYLKNRQVEKVDVLYYRKVAIRVDAELFVSKWDDFCYPSDVLLISLGDHALLYYEDVVYTEIDKKTEGKN